MIGFIAVYGAGLVSGFLGVLLLFKIKKPFDGLILMTEEDGKKTFTLELHRDPYELEKGDLITFLIKAPESRENN